MSKRDKIMHLLNQIQELYPELDSLMVDDLDNPTSIIIASEEKMRATAEAEGLDFDLVFEDEDEPNDLEQKLLKYFGYDKDKDKGPLQ
jgi:hypothetical protein